MLPAGAWPGVSALLLVAGAVSFRLAGRLLPPPGSRGFGAPVFLLAAALCFAGALAVEVLGHWRSGLRPADSAYSAMVYAASALNAQLVFALSIMTLFALARYFTGKLDAVRRVTFENTALLAYYTAAQGLAGLGLVHGFPRIAG
jgi:cytochrome c oxidase subunit I+III